MGWMAASQQHKVDDQPSVKWIKFISISDLQIVGNIGAIFLLTKKLFGWHTLVDATLGCFLWDTISWKYPLQRLTHNLLFNDNLLWSITVPMKTQAEVHSTIMPNTNNGCRLKMIIKSSHTSSCAKNPSSLDQTLSAGTWIFCRFLKQKHCWRILTYWLTWSIEWQLIVNQLNRLLPGPSNNWNFTVIFLKYDRFTVL